MPETSKGPQNFSEVPAPAGGSPDGVAAQKIADAIDPSMAIGAYRNDKHEYWWNGQGPVPSVTTILRILEKRGVTVHLAKESARAIYQAALAEWPLGYLSEDEAILWALKEADKIRDEAAELGSSVHLLADLVGNAPQGQESAPTGFGVSDDTFPYIEAYRRFLARYGASSIVSSEHMVWSLNGYAGTYDLIMRLPCDECQRDPIGYINGRIDCLHEELWLIDIKTSGKGPYVEWGLQLAAYRWADMIIVPGVPQGYRMPEIQRTGVLHLQPDLYPDTGGYQLWEYPTTYKDDYLRFLAALELYTWKKQGRFYKSRLHKR